MSDQNDESDKPRKFKRGPVETTTGMIRVQVYVQQEMEDYWAAKVGSNRISGGATRKEAIKLALEEASFKPSSYTVKDKLYAHR